MLKRGDCVFPRSGDPHPGFVERVGKTWADVDWGGWVKRMKTEWLVKPCEIMVPGLSGNDMTTHLIQTDGVDWPVAMTWCLPKSEVQQ